MRVRDPLIFLSLIGQSRFLAPLGMTEFSLRGSATCAMKLLHEMRQRFDGI
jgi:hypothetical protein